MTLGAHIAARTFASRGVGSVTIHGSGTKILQVANRTLRRSCDLVATMFSVRSLVLPRLEAMCSTKLLNTSRTASVIPNPTIGTSGISSLPPTSTTCVRDCALAAMIQRDLMRLECSGLGYMWDNLPRKYCWLRRAHEYTCFGIRGGYGCPLVYPNARLLGKRDVILDVALDITHVVIFLLWMSL
jgi:hypothetical protein